MNDKQKELEKKIFRLQAFCAAMVLIGGSIFLVGFSSDKKQKFGEIDVERINIVEKNGNLKMVISNEARQHPGTMDGVYYKEREGKRPAGMIFFSERGDEIGGLIFDGNDGKGQGGSLTFDKFRGDQTIQITHQEDEKGNYFAGLRMNDQNIAITDFINKTKEIEKLQSKEEQTAARKKLEESAGANRMFIGKAWNKKSLIQMSDAKGRMRLELSVEATGNPKLNFLDENGKVICSLPDDAKK